MEKKISEQIERLKVITAEMKALYPELEEVCWQIENVPYETLVEISTTRDRDITACNGRVFIHESFGLNGCTIILWSPKGRIKNTVEFETTAIIPEPQK